MNKDLLTFTASLLLLAFCIDVGTIQFASPSFLFLILVSLSVATWLIYFFMQKTIAENFIRNYLLTIVLKLLAGGIFIFVLLYLDPIGANANAILFMTAYFLFTGLEVGFLFKKFRQL